MFDTVAEIMQAVKEREEDSSWGLLRSQMEEDFLDFYTLRDYEAEAGYENYTTTSPRNFFDKVYDGLNSANLSIQIKLAENASEKERRRASVGELYLYGALAEVDRNLRVSGEPPLRQQMAFYLCSRGRVALRALVYPKKDRTVFDVLLWDTMHIVAERGMGGFLWVDCKRKLTKGQIKAEYGIEVRGKDAELMDWWDSERNAIIIEGVFAKKPTPHHLGHVPVYLGIVGGMPTMLGKDFVTMEQYRGDSVWAVSRKIYPKYNKVVSRTLDIYERSVAGSLVHKSRDGSRGLAPGVDPYKTFQEIKISTDAQEEIVPLETPKAPPETAILHSVMSTDISMSTLPYPLAYGGTKQAMSGAALGTLVEGTRSVYSPRTAVIEDCYNWLCEELLSQYASKGVGAEMKGFNPKHEFFQVKIKPKEIDPEWYIVVKCEPKLPRDKESEIMMSLAATQKRGPEDIPLISKQTAREDILQLRDPDSEEDKVLEEMGEGLPPIMAAKVAAALKARGKEDLAQDVMMLLNPRAAEREQQVPEELLMAAAEALAASGNETLQKLAMQIAQYVKGQAPTQGAPPTGGFTPARAQPMQPTPQPAPTVGPMGGQPAPTPEMMGQPQIG